MLLSRVLLSHIPTIPLPPAHDIVIAGVVEAEEVAELKGHKVRLGLALKGHKVQLGLVLKDLPALVLKDLPALELKDLPALELKDLKVFLVQLVGRRPSI